MPTKDDLMNALKKVLDPELGLNIVELGLVYSAKIKDDFAEVELTLTSPGCPMASEILADAEQNLLKIKGIKKAKVEFVFDPPWNPNMISAEGRAKLGI